MILLGLVLVVVGASVSMFAIIEYYRTRNETWLLGCASAVFVIGIGSYIVGFQAA